MKWESKREKGKRGGKGERFFEFRLIRKKIHKIIKSHLRFMRRLANLIIYLL